MTLLLAALASPLAAQETPTFASPFVPSEHWTMDAARRLDALGLAPAGFDAGQRVITRRELAVLFAHAARTAERRPDVAALMRAYRDRFVEEFGAAGAAAAGEPARVPRLVDGWIGVHYESRTGEILAGVGYPDRTPWSGARPVADVEGLASGFRWTPAFTRHLAAVVEPLLRDARGEVAAAYLVAAWRAVELWGGRRGVGYGPGAGGRIVFDGANTFDGGGIRLAEPVTAPGPLRYLGPIRVDMFLARVGRNGDFEDPWMWGMRGVVSPHPRVTFGVNRGIMFGGAGNTSLTARTFAYMLIGKHAGRGGEFDNQVVSVDVRWRPPLGPVPVVIYGEWGMEDSAGAWRDVPGIVIGAETPAVPGAPNVALGVEHTRFSRSCCGNPVWYRNWSFEGGWTDAGEPLGHPLGGHGDEWLLYTRADLLDARLRLRLRTFRRHRGEENLFVPQRTGVSAGGELAAEFRPTPSAEGYLSISLESADAGPVDQGWRASAIAVGVRFFLAPVGPDGAAR